MLRRTFVHVRGIGPGTERKLWHTGARDWDAFLALRRRGQLAGGRMASLEREIVQSVGALQRGASEFFEARLPAQERWRLYPEFASRAAYLDIETTGLSPGLDRVTVAGLHDGRRFRAFVRGKDLDRLPRTLERFALLVTFYGAQFDLPFLRAEMGRLPVRAHLDLRYPLARLGLTGGLKTIEPRVGIRRPAELAGVDGFEAVRLWRAHERGDRRALDRLVAYCEQDVRNLIPLAHHAVQALPAALGFPAAP